MQSFRDAQNREFTHLGPAEVPELSFTVGQIVDALIVEGNDLTRITPAQIDFYGGKTLCSLRDCSNCVLWVVIRTAAVSDEFPFGRTGPLIMKLYISNTFGYVS